MSELAVNKALKVVIENSVIPELETEVKELRKCKKYKQLYKNAKLLVQDLDRGNYEICYTCMKSTRHYNGIHCKACIRYICSNCIIKTTTTNPCINTDCSAIVHKKCVNKDILRVCGHCNNCCDC